MDLDRHGKHLCGRVYYFEVKEIEKHVEEGRVSSPVNLNKALYALEYLAQLRSAGLECLFKGGSAVVAPPPPWLAEAEHRPRHRG
jgi:hypothetical protein